MAFKIDSRGLQRVLEKVKTIAKRQAVLEAIGATVQTRVSRTFKTGTDPYGRPWQKLKRPSKKRGGASAQPLRHTGRLAASLTRRINPNARRVRVGAGVTYAKFHQFGTRRIPRRAFLPIRASGHPELPPQWERAVQSEAEKAVRRRIK